jgi:hypothetical protein
MKGGVIRNRDVDDGGRAIKEVILLKDHRGIGLLTVAVVLTLGASACASAPPPEPPTPPPAPKPAATTAPAAKPTTAPAVTTAPAAGATQAQSDLAVNKPINTAGSYKPADTLVLYGDTVLFSDQSNPDNCIVKSRYSAGEGVGFRMTAIDPQTGKVDETAELTVTVNYGGKSETVPMRFRGTGPNPHPGMWTGKWVVPDDAAAGLVKYSVVAKDSTGRSGTWQPFNVELSMLTIVK